MFEKIPVPVKGQPALASWGAGITNRVNELCSMVPSGGLARDGVTGTGFAPLPANKRDRKAARRIPGCFEIRSPSPAATDGGEDDPGGFDNPYYMVGGRIYSAANLHDFPISFEDEIVVLVVVLSESSPTASIQSFSSFEEIQTLADNEDVAVYPLYEFGNGGKVAVDLRNIPTVVAREFAGS